MVALERDYQPRLIKKLRAMFEGVVILKNDANYQQGFPDLILLFGPQWAILEVKRQRPTKASDFRPNQEYYIEMLNQMSFSACIYPENEDEVLSALQQTFGLRRPARGVKR